MFVLFVALIVVAEAVVVLGLGTVAPDVPVFALVPAAALTLILALLVRRWFGAYRMRRISPEAIARYRTRPPAAEEPEELARSIVERATEIRRTLDESPSEIRVEMCALGYRACVNDMITLTHLANEELENVNFLRRFKVRRARKKATDALAGARESLPPEALRAARQEQQ